MSRKKKTLWAADAETDPFLHGRVPEPFVWGAFNGDRYLHFDGENCTTDFLSWVCQANALIYAHNGGRFDFMFLLGHMNTGNIKVINSRVVEMRIGNSTLRDSWSIIPIALKDYQKTDIEYWKLEKECRDAHKEEIYLYLEDDCINLFNLVSEYRRQAGGGITIAGNALNYARKQCSIEVGRTSKKFDDKFRQFYFGGRCEAFRTGVFRDADIFDIKSAYPHAMMQPHGHGVDYAIRQNPLVLSDERLANCFLTVTCFASGCFPKREGLGLAFPHEFGTYRITGWEFLVARRHNLISQLTIHECFEFYDTIDFAPYVEHWFAHKQAADLVGDKANRIIGKIMLNSLYGKMAQNPARYRDYRVVDRDTEIDEGWSLDYEFDEIEIHTRSSLYELQKRNPDSWENFPIYYNVATGASITGHCRSVLLDAIHTVGPASVIYTDTDCIFVLPGAPTELLRQNGELGSWEHQGHADDFYCGGKKLYAAVGTFAGGKQEKIATKGFKATVEEIKCIIDGQVFVWHNPAPTFRLDGSADFVTRRIHRS